MHGQGYMLVSLFACYVMLACLLACFMKLVILVSVYVKCGSVIGDSACFVVVLR